MSAQNRVWQSVYQQAGGNVQGNTTTWQNSKIRWVVVMWSSGQFIDVNTSKYGVIIVRLLRLSWLCVWILNLWNFMSEYSWIRPLTARDFTEWSVHFYFPVKQFLPSTCNSNFHLGCSVVQYRILSYQGRLMIHLGSLLRLDLSCLQELRWMCMFLPLGMSCLETIIINSSSTICSFSST